MRLIGLHPSGAPGKVIHREVLSLKAPLAPGQAAHLRMLLEVGAEKPMLLCVSGVGWLQEPAVWHEGGWSVLQVASPVGSLVWIGLRGGCAEQHACS